MSKVVKRIVDCSASFLIANIFLFTRIDWETLNMIYNANKFRHCLLGKTLSFHEHITLLYLVRICKNMEIRTMDVWSYWNQTILSLWHFTYNIVHVHIIVTLYALVIIEPYCCKVRSMHHTQVTSMHTIRSTM